MRTLVVGYGSIGSRHARILKELGCPTAVVSRRKISFKPGYPSLSAGILSQRPEYVVVANRTGEHRKTVVELAKSGFRGYLLVEKPLFLKSGDFPKNHFRKVFVAYNLRFHPLLRGLKTLLQNEKILSAQAYVGKHLPEWRPGADYRKSYSARKNSGGGVLRDLSHELDYLNWLFGGWTAVTAVGGHFSGLEIDSDDVFCLLMATRRCPAVMVQMNYVDRAGRREMVVNTDRHNYRVDLMNGELEIDGRVKRCRVERDDTYRLEHRAVIERRFGHLTTLEEGMETMRLIDAAEKASRKKIWVKR
ncbi:MAG: Gfo/Idh/MocA family oxidoreductase [Candidatus Omnitrophica bacterium]|nr:Gfo/Idh/MocA family oxidoreductase [Candidatus Omnitrophota bacterium]